jgi:hypothetical protein
MLLLLSLFHYYSNYFNYYLYYFKTGNGDLGEFSFIAEKRPLDASPSTTSGISWPLQASRIKASYPSVGPTETAAPFG